jgi:hypothetical protein
VKGWYGYKNVDTGETVRFRNADFSRLLAGVRMFHTINPSTVVYGGGACVYELAGKVEATANAVNINSPSL